MVRWWGVGRGGVSEDWKKEVHGNEIGSIGRNKSDTRKRTKNNKHDRECGVY